MGLDWAALAGIPENRDEQVEAFRRRHVVRSRPCASLGGRGGYGRLSPPSPLCQPSLLVRAALSDQLSAQLRPGLHARHLRLLRRPVEQLLLPGLGRVHRPGRPPPSLLLISAGRSAPASLISGAPTRS